MLLKFSEKIVDSLISKGVVPSEEKDLYEYGIRQGIVMVLNALTIILIGLILGMFWYSILFMLAFIPIRPYAGGYHASSQLTCYLSSIPLTLAVLVGIRMIPWTGYICFIALFCAGMLILLLAPVEDFNKPLEQIERTVYKKRSRVALAALSSVAILFWLMEIEQISISITMALGVVAVMLVLGVLKNKNLIKEKA